MSFIDLAKRRQSCREYAETAVTREQLDLLIEAAKLAPSACNSQPWRFVVVNEKKTIDELLPVFQNGIPTMNRFTAKCQAFIVIAEGTANLSAKFGGKLSNQEYAQIDLGLCTAHLCLQAADMGLGTCIIGWFDEKKTKAVLGIPKDRRVRLIIAVGYPADDTVREKKRKPTDELVSFNRW